ncbi:MAG: hypothetical protein ABIS14_16030 [Sphingomonas sp.]
MTVSQALRRAGPYLVLALTCLLGWAFKGHCGAYWTDAIQYRTGCYSDAVPFWGLRGVSAGQVPYVQARIEYPVLTGALIWIEGWVTRSVWGASADAADFLAVVAAVNAALAFQVMRMIAAAGADRARLYAWAAAPPLILYLGHNWDMLAVALAVTAVLAARRGALPNAAGLAALGSAAKLFPVLLLPLLGLDALSGRAGGSARTRIERAAWLVVIAIGFWGAVNLPFAWRAFHNWSEFYRFSSARGGTAASIWELLSAFHIWRSGISARNIASFALFAVGAAGIVALGWRRHAARPWLLFTPVLAWFLLTNKVYSPQFDLWLYPLLVLTSHRLWPLAWFALGDLLAYVAEFWWFAGLAGHTPSATQGDIAVAAAIRGAALSWIIVAAIRQPAPRWVETVPA